MFFSNIRDEYYCYFLTDPSFLTEYFLNSWTNFKQHDITFEPTLNNVTITAVNFWRNPQLTPNTSSILEPTLNNATITAEPTLKNATITSKPTLKNATITAVNFWRISQLTPNFFNSWTNFKQLDELLLNHL